MGLMDMLFAGGGSGASKQSAQGYQNAMNYLNPYYQGGLEDYNQYRGDINSMGQSLAPYQNAGNSLYNQINQSPQEYYQSLMNGYTESPQAKQQQEDMMNAANSAGLATGTAGSGSFDKALQQNTQDITAQDQQQWLNNMMGVSNQQLSYLNNLQGQQAQYQNAMNGLAGMGYNSANTMGNYAIGQGNANAYGQMANSQGLTGLIGGGLGFLGGL